MESESDFSDFESDSDGEVEDEVSPLSTPLEGIAAPPADGAPPPPSAKPDPRLKKLALPHSMPYPVESLEEMDHRLELIARRLVDCVEAGEWERGFHGWTTHLRNWLALKYPMKREMRIRLASLYYELAVVPGLDPTVMGVACRMAINLLKPRKLIGINDLRLDWKPLHEMLLRELFPKRRKVGHTNVSTFLLDLAEVAQRFSHPSAVDEMLDAILPRLHGDDIDTIIATQAFLVHFLPFSHPQKWLAVLFKLWEGINSGLWDEQMLDLLARLSTMHVNPRRSDPELLDKIPKTRFNPPAAFDAAPADRPYDAMDVDSVSSSRCESPAMQGPTAESISEWPGIRKEVGILTEKEFEMVMTKCLRSMGTPVGGATASAAASSKTVMDSAASKTSLQMKKPTDKLTSLAQIIVYSMAEDSAVAGNPSAAASGTQTPVNPSLARVVRTNGLKPIASSDSLAAAGRKVDSQHTCLAGSKALDHLARLIMSCETFFHPSNYGRWTLTLTAFIQDLTWEFTKRWKAEEKADCRTPQAWRLTPAIKVEFVKTIRTVALLSMFAKDAASMSATRSALRSMSILEPDLIIQPIIERAIPSLQGLEETHRTTAVLKALSGVSRAMLMRPIGRVNITALLELSLPGIDMNDPGKTIATVLFLMSLLSQMRLGDLSEDPPEGISHRDGHNGAIQPDIVLSDGDGDAMMQSSEDLDMQFRQSTVILPDWLSQFLGKIFTLYDAMPEESETRGKGMATQEEQVVGIVHSCLETILNNLDEQQTSKILQQVFEYVTTTVRANSSRVINGLVSALSAVLPGPTLAIFFPVCRDRILSELSFGASSTRTTSTTITVSSDATLHWYMALLYGALRSAGRELLNYQDEMIDFLNKIVALTYSESGWGWSGRIINRILINLTSTCATEDRIVNPEEWQSGTFQYYHDEFWGERYDFSKVKADWHVPNQQEVDFALRIVKEVLSGPLCNLESLVATQDAKDQVWHNEFCRYLNHVRNGLSALNTLCLEYPEDKTGGKPGRDLAYVPTDFMDQKKSVAAAFLLTDEKDPRYRSYMAFRARAGRALHAACAIFQQAHADGLIDGLKMTIRTIGIYALSYGVEQKPYDKALKSYTYLERQTRYYANEKSMPRTIWVRRMELYNDTRSRMNSMRRQRSDLDDLLINDLLQMSLSLFVRIRKLAQTMLFNIASVYDGTKSTLVPRLLEALRPGEHPDVMKGSLFTLTSRSMLAFQMHDWQYMPNFITHLLQCQHQEKPSIQALVNKSLGDASANLSEPLTLRLDTNSKGLTEAVQGILDAVTQPPTSQDLIQSVRDSVETMFTVKNDAYDSLVADLLKIADDPPTHWRYTATIAFMLRMLLRRDKATAASMAKWFAVRAVDSHPTIRAHAQGALIRALYIVKLRSLCQGSAERLFMQKGANPLKRKVQLSDTSHEFTRQYLQSFSQETAARSVNKGSDSDQWMQDKQATGWLCWGNEVVQSRLAGWEEMAFEWENDSKAAMEAMHECVSDDEWWKTLISHWSQEKSRQWLSADVIDVVRSLCQIYVDLPFEKLRPHMETLLEDKESKDKQRVLAELIGGLLRGSKHWPGKAREALWTWLTPRLPQIYGKIRHETYEYWKMFFEHVLYKRDPRRMQPLLQFIIETGRNCDFNAASAFEQKTNVQLVSSAIRCLAWRFTPWADEFVNLYLKNVDSDYLEVRSLISSNLMLLDNVYWHPSYPSVAALVADCTDGSHVDVIGKDGHLTDRFEQLLDTLPGLRAVRPQGPKAASSPYDKTSSTLLYWLYNALTDTHAAASFGYAMKALPEIMHMREMIDNPELPKVAALLLVYVTAVTPPVHLVEPLIKILVSTLRESTSWKIRLHALPVLSIIYYRELPLISEECAVSIMDALSRLLHDENSEVRETAAATLSGVLRCSRRASINVLKERFVREARNIKLPVRRDASGNISADYQAKVIQLHGAVLGITALIEAFPYEVPAFLPHLLTEVLAEHASDPTPISTTIRACAGNFQKTHADTWLSTDKAKFTDDQLSNLTYLISGTSYYA